MDELAARLDKLHTLEAASDIAGVVGQLRENNVAHPGLQKVGWRALLGLVPYPGGGLKNTQMEAAVQAGALEVAVAALQEQRTREDVVTAVCEVLVVLIQGYSLEVGASGAIEAMVAAMREHEADLDLQEQAFMVLFGLQPFSPTATHAARRQANVFQRPTRAVQARQALLKQWWLRYGEQASHAHYPCLS